jgi:electron transfer flavoprotein beta subunit
VKMPDIMKAKRKPLDVLALDSLGVERPPALETLALATPPKRTAGARVKDVQELVAALKQRGLL